MSTLTEPTRIGDVLRRELWQSFCREELTVLDGQTLVIGEACKLNAAGKVVTCEAAAVDAVQTITPSVASNADEVHTITPSVGSNVTEVQTIEAGSLAAGNYRLRFTHPVTGTKFITDVLVHNDNAATVETAITAAVGANEVAVSGSDLANGLVLTYTDGATAWDNQDVPIVEILPDSAFSDVATSAIKTTTGAGIIARGTYKLGITDIAGNKQWTKPIAFSAAAGAINTALDDAMGAALVVATGGPINGPTAIVLTYSGTGYTHLPHPTLVEMDISNLVGCDDVSIVRTTVGAGVIRADGTWMLALADTNGDYQWTYPLAADADAAAVVAAITDAMGVAACSVTGGELDTPAAFVITFDGTGYTGLGQSPLLIDLSNMVGLDDVSIVDTTAGGAVGADATMICLEAASPSSGDGAAVMLVRGPAIVDADQLTVPSGGAANVKTALKAVQILAISEPAQYDEGLPIT